MIPLQPQTVIAFCLCIEDYGPILHSLADTAKLWKWKHKCGGSTLYKILTKYLSFRVYLTFRSLLLDLELILLPLVHWFKNSHAVMPVRTAISARKSFYARRSFASIKLFNLFIWRLLLSASILISQKALTAGRQIYTTFKVSPQPTIYIP